MYGRSILYFIEGLSPRGRGKQKRRRAGCAYPRSIPAWAGETLISADTNTTAAVYPRVGGGNLREANLPIHYDGLSPRGRGKRHRRRSNRGLDRSIPAWAGETLCAHDSRRRIMVYPRVGGGNRACSVWRRSLDGLSPRGRGKRGRVHQWAHNHRSIPAWAGETAGNHTRPALASVYPRVGGGNHDDKPHSQSEAGLSPRGRGKQAFYRHFVALYRSIPAWAGETRTR